MGSSLSYGDAFGRRFGAERAAAFVTTTLRKTDVAVTYLDQPEPTFQMSEPQPYQDAYLVSMGFFDFPNYQLWEDGRPVRSAPITAPQVTMYDLRAAPAIFVNNPMVGLHFHIPRSAFNALADAEGKRRIGDLDYPAGSGVDDRVIHHLGMAMMPAFLKPEQASQLFVDSVTLAITAHVAQTYGGMREDTARRGGLAPWQERLAKEIFDAYLDGDISQIEVARRCGLSPSHFARAFRVSTGHAPHRWLLQRRIDKAKALLREGHLPLAEIAIASGFADQSHFTRVFTRIAGVAPGAWRRAARD
ncbi:MAG: helix-turn-helix transcriptional regulator [Proteobacteria bacterium]|nr:helix-turn-helix transcriptional regulator [Pseudomonadota bacterium]